MTLTKYLKHIIDCKKEYWGKDEYIYRFYDAQEVLIRDLLCQEKDKNYQLGLKMLKDERD